MRFVFQDWVLPLWSLCSFATPTTSWFWPGVSITSLSPSALRCLGPHVQMSGIQRAALKSSAMKTARMAPLATPPLET